MQGNVADCGTRSMTDNASYTHQVRLLAWDAQVLGGILSSTTGLGLTSPSKITTVCSSMDAMVRCTSILRLSMQCMEVQRIHVHGCVEAGIRRVPREHCEMGPLSGKSFYDSTGRLARRSTWSREVPEARS